MMTIKDGMVLTKLGDSYAVVSSGEDSDFHGIIKMNKTGADIWKLIEEGFQESEIASILVKKYDGVDFDCALRDVNTIVEVLRKKGILSK
jgi:hypothetical protein